MLHLKLSDHEKQIIATINEQVKLLLEKSASESIIVNTLFDFIPDVKCILNSTEEKELQLYLANYTNFAYFLTLIDFSLDLQT
jgi:hypothetical protein